MTEECRLCEKSATHKVADTRSEIGGMRIHPLTNYLCCEHFVILMGTSAASQCSGCDAMPDWVKAGEVEIKTRRKVDVGKAVEGFGEAMSRMMSRIASAKD